MSYILWAILALLPPVSLTGEVNPPPDLSGSWAQKQIQTSVSEIPVIGQVESKTVAYLRMDISQEGEQITIDARPCWIKIESEIEQVKTVVPAEMLDAIGTYKLKAQLRPNKKNQWEFYQPPTVTVLGAKLKQKWTEKLPSTPADPRVFDADRDGNPGVTVRVFGLMDGAIYLVQRSWSELTGVLSSKNDIRGLVRWRTTQSILDATRGPLKSNPGAAPHPDAKKSWFAMHRVDPSTTCQDVIINRNKLFKP